MVSLRPYRPDDLDALYAICLRTASSGDDATALHNDLKAVGHVYAAPYGVLEPERVLIAEDDEGVAGYIVGTFDSDAFAARLEQDWWPALRSHYAGIDPATLTQTDRMRVDAMLNPAGNPPHIVADYPAHIHMNLLPRLRGQRVGSALLENWIGLARDAGVRGIHLGANARNSGGIAFWQHGGFKPLETIGRTAWFGMVL